MSKKAVWLSDIEFIEMHSSDWERLESEAFEPDESVQAQLNENQQKYLKLLKRAYEKFGNVYDGIFFSLVDYEKRYGLPAREFFQVLDNLKVWALEQEEEE